MLTKEEIVRLLKENHAYLSSEYGISKLGLFGSFANGQPSEVSDVDLFVEFERPIGFKFVELAEYLERLMGRKVDVLTPAGIQSIRIKRLANEIAGSIVYV